jgi:hypothetical protein
MTAQIINFAQRVAAHGVRRLAVHGAAEATTSVRVHMRRVNGGMPATTPDGLPLNVQVEAADGPFAGTTIATGTAKEMDAWLQAHGFRPVVPLATHTRPVTAGHWVKDTA